MLSSEEAGGGGGGGKGSMDRLRFVFEADAALTLAFELRRDWDCAVLSGGVGGAAFPLAATLPELLSRSESGADSFSSPDELVGVSIADDADEEADASTVDKRAGGGVLSSGASEGFSRRIFAGVSSSSCISAALCDRDSMALGVSHAIILKATVLKRLAAKER